MNGKIGWLPCDGGGARCSGGGGGGNHRRRSREGDGDGCLEPGRSGILDREHFVLIDASLCGITPKRSSYTTKRDSLLLFWRLNERMNEFGSVMKDLELRDEDKRKE